MSVMARCAGVGSRLVERGLVPDGLTRAGIRALCRQRLASLAEAPTTLADFVAMMRSGPIAPVPAAANRQHYEVPAEFYELVLGPRRKYSACYFAESSTSLAEAETAALEQTAEHAGLADGMEILELGCGWGAVSLFLAERYPSARITAVSNSSSQRAFIERAAAERGLQHLRVVTADMNDFQPQGRYDRIVSVEMFEHMRNWPRLFERVASWLLPDGRMLMHVFAHQTRAYVFETEGAANWMGRHFFTGGLMPSLSLPAAIDEHLSVAARWTWDGTHYQRTAEAWLANLDRHRPQAAAILSRDPQGPSGAIALERWRVFFMACAELFGYRAGAEWCVGHFLLAPVAHQ
jgi:cyclopropane-fatty-acyl-phospholipid synthase